MPWRNKLEEWAQHPCTKALVDELTADVAILQDKLEQADDMNEIRLTQGLLREAQSVLGMLINLDINQPEGAENESGE